MHFRRRYRKTKPGWWWDIEWDHPACKGREFDSTRNSSAAYEFHFIFCKIIFLSRELCKKWPSKKTVRWPHYPHRRLMLHFHSLKRWQPHFSHTPCAPATAVCSLMWVKALSHCRLQVSAGACCSLGLSPSSLWTDSEYILDVFKGWEGILYKI